MSDRIELLAALLLMALVAAMVAMVAWLTPGVWSQLDPTVVVMASCVSWLCVAWALVAGPKVFIDPNGELDPYPR